MELVYTILSYSLIITGSFFIITCGMGIVRMPDFYTRLHPAGLTDSIGAPLVLLGLVFMNGFDLNDIKILILILFLYLTSPTATHAIAKAALVSGLELGSVTNDERETE